jgi:hypothetical protein
MGNCSVAAPLLSELDFGDQFSFVIVKYLNEIIFLVLRDHSAADDHHVLRQETDRAQRVAEDSRKLICDAGVGAFCGVNNFEEVSSTDN